MAEMFAYGKLVVVREKYFLANGHHLSLLKDDLVDLFGDRTLQICSYAVDELTIRLWKASTLRSSSPEGGFILAANIMRNFPASFAAETTQPLLTSELQASTHKKVTTVFCSALFCRIFRLSNHERVVFRLCANVPHIERVVLGAATEEAFQWASSNSFRAELGRVMSKRTLLCSEGCTFGLNSNHFLSDDRTGFWEQLHVVGCVPTCQGRLTEMSEFVVRRHSHQSDMTDCSDCGDTVGKAVMVADFASVVKDTFQSCQKLDVCLTKLEECEPSHKLNIVVVMDVDKMKSLIDFQQSQDVSDEFSVTVFSRHCASRLGIMNGNVLQLSCKSHEGSKCIVKSSVTLPEDCSHSCRQKTVIACVDTTTDSCNMAAYVSSCTWFNTCSRSCLSLSGTCDSRPCYLKVWLPLMHYCTYCVFLIRYSHFTHICKLF